MGDRHRSRTSPSRSEAPAGGAAGGTTATTPAVSSDVIGGARRRRGEDIATRRARGAGGAAERTGAPALGNYAHSPSRPGRPAQGGPEVEVADAPLDEAVAARVRRAERWHLLAAARPVTSLSRLRQCRKVTLTGTGGPTLRVSGSRGAGYAGLSTCGSVWACPCCAPKIAAERAGELADVIAAVHRQGGSAYLVTYTLRHHRGQRLASLWDAVSAAWAAVTSGKAWVADQQGMAGWARVVEVTHTPRSGWHVHVHVLMCWHGEVDDDHAQRVALRGWLRWDRALRRHDLDSTPVRGVDARRVRVGSEGLGEYFVKAAREVTGGHAKDSRSGRSPLAILRDAVETYAADDVALLWEWEQASHGRRQLTWSTSERMNLRRLAGLADEQSGTAPWLLTLAETDGADGVTAWLDARDLAWSRPARGPRRAPRDGLSPQTRREARAVLTRPAWPGSPTS